MKLRQPFKSTRKNKKYDVFIKTSQGTIKKISFGDSRYGQYHDKLGEYSHLDHFDKKRRANYHSRHGKATDRNSAKFFSHKYLW